MNIGIVRRRICVVILGLVTMIVFGGVDAEVHADLCLYGCPSGAPASNDLIVRPIYILSSNDETNLADWVAYRVTEKGLGPSRKRKWYTDPVLDADETLEKADYKGAHAALNTDRGHQVPLASFAGTPYWETTNYLSNITPQKSALNQGPWKNLEEVERRLSREGYAVYVMTGPLYGDNDIPLPGADEPTEVPEAYWKVISWEVEEVIQTVAFLMPQEAGRKDPVCSFLSTVEEVAVRSGLSFFHAANYPEDAHQLITSAEACEKAL